ncbi:MAG TPA: hypothetical protein VN785_12330 [Candidatus Angelobacter sp.]|nr:hypothetical protein [Candidatus Angelobacter sp.]
MDSKHLIDFLLTGSRSSTKNAFLMHLSEESNKRKQIVELLEAWAEERAQLIALEFFLAHGEEITSRLGQQEERPALPSAQPFALPRAFNKPRTWRKR